jgi:hypothetical protein
MQMGWPPAICPKGCRAKHTIEIIEKLYGETAVLRIGGTKLLGALRRLKKSDLNLSGFGRPIRFFNGEARGEP